MNSTVNNLSKSLLNPELMDLLQSKAQEMDVECPVCLCVFDNPYLLKTCQHIFCEACIKSCLGDHQEQSCPLCRRKFTKLDLAADNLKKVNIENIVKRCRAELEKSKACVNTSTVTSLVDKKVELLKHSTSKIEIGNPSDNLQKLSVESHNIRLQSRNEEALSNQIKHKYGQMLQSVISNIEEDLSNIPGQEATFKSQWSSEQKAKFLALREGQLVSYMNNNCKTVSEFMNHMESLARVLAGILGIQKKTLVLKVSANEQNTSQFFNNGVTIHGEGGVMTSIRGGTIRINRGTSSLVFSSDNLSLNNSRLLELLSGNTNALSEVNAQTFVGNREVRRSDAPIIKAMVQVDEILLDCFSHRYLEGEYGKAFGALSKVSSESLNKQNDALISLGSYYNELLSNDKLEELLALFNEHASSIEDVILLGKLYETLVSLGSGNREKIQIIMLSLNVNTLESLKLQILDSIENDSFIESSLQLLCLCEEHANWCTQQISSIIERHIDKGENEVAARLVDKYLMGQVNTKDKGIKYLNKILRHEVKENNTTNACKLVDKYFLNKAESYQEGMKHIKELVGYNVDHNYANDACKLIDKYFLDKAESHQEGMNYIKELVGYNVDRNYANDACKLIDKYFLDKAVSHQEGMNYIKELVAYNVNRNYANDACKLIDKYFLDKAESYQEGMEYIKELIAYNVKQNYANDACKLIDKYFLNKAESYQEGINYIKKLIDYNVKQNYVNDACKLIDGYLLRKEDTRKEAKHYIEKLISYNKKRGYEKDVSKLVGKYSYLID